MLAVFANGARRDAARAGSSPPLRLDFVGWRF